MSRRQARLDRVGKNTDQNNQHLEYNIKCRHRGTIQKANQSERIQEPRITDPIPEKKAEIEDLWAIESLQSRRSSLATMRCIRTSNRPLLVGVRFRHRGQHRLIEQPCLTPLCPLSSFRSVEDQRYPAAPSSSHRRLYVRRRR